jgi:2,4-dienoyl-CoA reductase-like NADH-dependent reductase (Old Yellow Enzyme family)
MIGPLTLKNRVVMSALTRSRSVPTNVPNDINLEYYTQRARGGAGLIITEGTMICQQGHVIHSVTSTKADYFDSTGLNGRMHLEYGIRTRLLLGKG